MHVKITKSTDRPHLKRKIKPEHMEIKQKDITWHNCGEVISLKMPVHI